MKLICASSLVSHMIFCTIVHFQMSVFHCCCCHFNSCLCLWFFLLPKVALFWGEKVCDGFSSNKDKWDKKVTYWWRFFLLFLLFKLIMSYLLLSLLLFLKPCLKLSYLFNKMKWTTSWHFHFFTFKRFFSSIILCVMPCLGNRKWKKNIKIFIVKILHYMCVSLCLWWKRQFLNQ